VCRFAESVVSPRSDTREAPWQSRGAARATFDAHTYPPSLCVCRPPLLPSGGQLLPDLLGVVHSREQVKRQKPANDRRRQRLPPAIEVRGYVPRRVAKVRPVSRRLAAHGGRFTAFPPFHREIPFRIRITFVKRHRSAPGLQWRHSQPTRVGNACAFVSARLRCPSSCGCFVTLLLGKCSSPLVLTDPSVTQAQRGTALPTRYPIYSRSNEPGVYCLTHCDTALLAPDHFPSVLPPDRG